MVKIIALKLLKMIGIKSILRMGWKHLIYPKLKTWVESNKYPEWDEKLLSFVNLNINKVIDLI